MAKEKEWTIMVYLAGDNNLSENMIWSLIGMQNAMKAKGSDEQVNLISIFDSGYPTVPIQTYHFTHQNSSKPLTEIAQDAPKQKDETIDIKDFINQVVSDKKFEAKNYALIMSGHSDGILGKTMFRDDNPESVIELNYLGYILKLSKHCLEKNKNKFQKKNRKFALIAFDSCMMGTLEVGYELSDVAEYMVASQGYAPPDGWNFELILKKLIRKKGELSPEEFAKSIVNSQADFNNNYQAGGRSADLSCVDLNQAADLGDSLNGLAKVFNKLLKTKADGITDAVIRESVKNLIHQSHYVSQTYLHEQSVDILDFVNNLSSNCDLKMKELELFAGQLPEDKDSNAELFRHQLDLIKQNCDKIRIALGKSKKGDYLSDGYVILNRSTGSEYQFAEGVSVFFPWTLLAYYMIYQKYNRLKFSKKSAWVDFIERFAKLTLRVNGEPRFDESPDYLTWVSNVETAHRADSAKADSAKADSARADSAKADSAKGAHETFYRLFRRFRNHPIYHKVAK